jgi:hypothetical protein
MKVKFRRRLKKLILLSSPKVHAVMEPFPISFGSFGVFVENSASNFRP